LKKKQIKKKKSVDKQSALVDLLRKHGAQIYDDIDYGNFPKFTIPSRSVSNIVYDKKIRQYILGANMAVRSSRNTSQLRSFTQLMWLAFFANRLTGQKKSSTLRDVYYSSQAFAVDFEDQSESDNIIVDLEAVLASPRESFHVFPEERSSVFGDLTIEYTVPGYEGKKTNLSDHPDFHHRRSVQTISHNRQSEPTKAGILFLQPAYPTQLAGIQLKRLRHVRLHDVPPENVPVHE